MGTRVTKYNPGHSSATAKAGGMEGVSYKTSGSYSLECRKAESRTVQNIASYVRETPSVLESCGDEKQRNPDVIRDKVRGSLSKLCASCNEMFHVSN